MDRSSSAAISRKGTCQANETARRDDMTLEDDIKGKCILVQLADPASEDEPMFKETKLYCGDDKQSFLKKAGGLEGQFVPTAVWKQAEGGEKPEKVHEGKNVPRKEWSAFISKAKDLSSRKGIEIPTAIVDSDERAFSVSWEGKDGTSTIWARSPLRE